MSLLIAKGAWGQARAKDFDRWGFTVASYIEARGMWRAASRAEIGIGGRLNSI